MRRILFAVFLALLALGTSAVAQGLRRCPKEARQAAPGETVVGEVISPSRQLRGNPPGGVSASLPRCSEIVRQMQVNSGNEAGTWIAMNPGGPGRKGFVALGPETEVEFSDFVIDAAAGKTVKMDWRMQLGQFRVALAPHTGEPGKGEYLIRVPADGKRKAVEIRLAGTDVYVAADEQSTTIAVFEGLVIVDVEGRRVTLTAGTWTRIGPGGIPSEPAALGASLAALSPTLLWPIPSVPEDLVEHELITNPRLDLPK